MDFVLRKYPKYEPEIKAWRNGLFTAIIILLIFLLFQPFGLRDKTIGLKLVLYPGYAVLGFIYSVSVFFIVRFLMKSKQSWSLKNELVLLFAGAAILALIIHLFTWLVSDDMPLTLTWYLKLFYHTASLVLLIGVIEYFYYNSRVISNRFKDTTSVREDRKSEIIVFNLENEKTEINRNKIRVIKSVGNYLEFYLSESDGTFNKMLKRGRLHQVENDLASCPEFFKCHRAFIVNLKKGAQLLGNSRNARIVFEGIKQQIPVSRANYKNLKAQLEKIVLE